ncbi:MAG: GNAT family protein [Candidatus Zixiibacteriota bacterium]
MAEKGQPLPTQPSLVGKNIFLRPTTAEDIINIHVWFMQSEPQAQSERPIKFRTPAEAAEAFKNQEKSTDRQAFTIVRKEDKIPVGQITFFNYNPLNRSAELGILIDPDERKNGHAADAMRVLIKYLFKYRDLNKVHASTAKFNKAAVALLESVGFKKDGALRNHHFYNGEYYDKLVYSMLRFELDW